MPGWHDATTELQNDDAFQMVGLVQEQHPDRARLFMQWKEMDWPVMVDAFNELQVRLVPITLFIDEHGVIRENRVPRRNFMNALREFLDTEYPAPEFTPALPMHQADADVIWLRGRGGTPDEQRHAGRALAKWTDATHLDEAVTFLETAAEEQPDHALGHFQLGVALRARFDSDHRKPTDFQNAIDAWTAALERNPNQYIWRRRIQQYGPRLDKPYSFYDWVNEARTEIRARGEEPASLDVEPSGAEFAHPARSFSADTSDDAPPSTDEGVTLDTDPLIVTNVAVVPPNPKPGTTARVHLMFRPNPKTDGHWNNEAEPMRVHITSIDHGSTDTRRLVIDNASTATSDELRRAEFEIRIDDDVDAETITINGYAVYNVCRGERGVCIFRRRNLSIDVPTR